MIDVLAMEFVDSIISANRKYVDICSDCGQVIVKEHKGYYCEGCGTEYIKCPVCGDLVTEDEIEYFYEDKICKYCLEENEYGK